MDFYPSSIGSNTAVENPARTSCVLQNLNPLTLTPQVLSDVLNCLLHTILFIRAPGPVEPVYETCVYFPAISYAQCRFGSEILNQINRVVKKITRQLKYSPIQDGEVKVVFFHRKVKKALFGLMSNEQKVYWEQWILPIHVEQHESNPEETMKTVAQDLQTNLFNIMSAMQNIEHIPNTMYDFDIVYADSLSESSTVEE